MNILIPMAGEGKRFKDKGFTLPKPLIDINGKPMIERVVENINLQSCYIFIVLREHFEQFNLGKRLKDIKKDCKIICVDQVTKGAACTCLLAKDLINNNDPLLIANCDQLVDWNSKNFINYCGQFDGGILTYKSKNPACSFVKKNGDYIDLVAEKKVISNIATVGIYFWKRGQDFVNSSEQMIKDNFCVNGEFYVAPTYNYLIKKGLKIVNYNIKNVYNIGTPEGLNDFLNRKLI